MPFEDRTSPLQQGPMTGRGRGLCARPAVAGGLHPGRGPAFDKGSGCQHWGQRRGQQPGQRSPFRSAPGNAWETPATACSAPAEHTREVAALRGMINELRRSLDQLRRQVEAKTPAPGTE